MTMRYKILDKRVSLWYNVSENGREQPQLILVKERSAEDLIPSMPSIAPFLEEEEPWTRK